jgi:hypothetical protein
MRLKPLGLAALLLAGSALSNAAEDLIGVGGNLVGATVTVYDGATYTSLPGEGIRLGLAPRYAAFAMNMGGANWSAYSHVVITVTNNQSTMVNAEFAIDSGTTGWAWSDFVLPANATRTIAIPLRTSQSTLGLPDWPTIPGSVAQGTLHGSTTPSNIRMLRFWNVQEQRPIDLTVRQITASNFTQPTTGFVDVFGQQTVPFPDKVVSNTDLTSQAAEEAGLIGLLPYSNDQYSGVAGSALSNGTGRWATAKQNGKWYILDPEGNRFFSTGVICVGTGTLAYTQGRTSLFEAGALPSTTGTFASNYQSLINPGTGSAEFGYNFYTSNLQRKYGTNWTMPALDNIVKRMRTWGFNTVGPLSHSGLYNPARQVPTMPGTAITGTYKTVPCPNAGFAMPDVYDPAWATAVSNSLTPVVANLNPNPYNVGLFVDNELPWAFHKINANSRYDFAFNVLSAPSTQPAKVRFYNQVSLTYRTISKLNAAWGTNYASWTAFKNNTNFRPTLIKAGLARDMQTFLTNYANQYFSTIRTKLTNLQYKGLYLGCRFLYYSPESLAACGRYCDVVSFNAYDIKPSDWRADLKALDRPVMVSEFGFGAADAGRVGGGGVVTEADRVAVYNNYVNDAMTWPNMVGLHWYKWDDDPASGRMWDNANHSLGLVSIADNPYDQLAAAATLKNTELNARLINP